MSEENPAMPYILFFGESPIALLIALLVAIPVLGPLAGRSLDQVAISCGEAVKPMALIILVIGGGGAFKQVLVDSGIADYIAELTSGWNVSPLLLAWGIAALLRVSLGSATVAVVGEVPLARLWHAVPSYPTISEVWLRLLETYRR